MTPDHVTRVFRRILREAAGVLSEPFDSSGSAKTSSTIAGYCLGRPPDGVLANAPTAVRDAGHDLARMAYFEAASVEAFLQLTEELELHGAPLHLVASAEQAARDEVCHAQACGVLARRRGIMPTAPQVVGHTPRGLEQLAHHNAVEGCVTEAFGALVGLAQANNATATDVRSAMAFIAADETAHAAFSYELQAWLESQLSKHALARVREAREAAVAHLLEQTLFSEDVPWRAELGLPHADAMFELARAFRRELHG